MKPIPIAQYLNQVSRPAPVAPEASAKATVLARTLPAPQLVENTQERLNARLEEAYQRGLREGRESARVEAEETSRQRQADLAKAASDERDAFRADECAALAEKISLGLKTIETLIAESVARILKPYLIDAHSKQVLGALHETLTRMFSSPISDIIEISGPEGLVDPLRKALAPYSIRCDFKITQAIDVKVKIRQTLIESQLKRWIDHVSAVQG